MLGKIRIETNGSPVATRWKLLLDDMDISRFVRRVSFSAEAGKFPTMTIELVGQLELPDDMQALVDIYGISEKESVNV